MTAATTVASEYSASQIEAALKLDAWLAEPINGGDRKIVTIESIAEFLDNDVAYAHDVLHVHRNALTSSSWAILHMVMGTSHVYTLSSNPVEIATYGAHRIDVFLTQAKTMLAVSNRGTRATSGNTKLGKNFRQVTKMLGRLIEDLEEVDDVYENITTPVH